MLSDIHVIFSEEERAAIRVMNGAMTTVPWDDVRTMLTGAQHSGTASQRLRVMVWEMGSIQSRLVTGFRTTGRVKPVDREFIVKSTCVEASELPTEECCVCYDKTINTRLDPCGHIALCHICALQLIPVRCPLCRIHVTHITKLTLKQEIVQPTAVSSKK